MQLWTDRRLRDPKGHKLSTQIPRKPRKPLKGLNIVNVGLPAYAGGKNVSHRTTLAALHSTAQTRYALPHRGRSTSRIAADQYVLGSAGSSRSAICVCAFVSRVMPSIMACTACTVAGDGLRAPGFP